MVEINKGSIESVAIDVTDRFNNLTTLDTASLTFDITQFDGTPIVTAQGCPNTGMTAMPQVDTTPSDYEIGASYKIYINFTALPDYPRLGPVTFKVV